MMKGFWLTFLPIFMAVNAIGLLPMFLSFTVGLERHQVRRIIIQSTVTATIVALVFLFVGSAILEVLGITVADFLIAGGVLLFIISLDDLLSTKKKAEHIDPGSLGAVPLGVPLIVGPAVLTTILMLAPEQGVPVTIVSIVLNIFIAGLMFWLSQPIIRFVGNSGAKTLGKIGDLLLASIAVVMVRKGLVMIVTQFGNK